MSTVTINYADITSAAEYSHNTSGRMQKYSSDLELMVAHTLRFLPGDDSSGFVSSALGSLNSKRNELSSNVFVLTTGQNMIKGIGQMAKSVDKEVASNISRLAEPYVKEMTILQKGSSLLYNIFCVEAGAFASDIGFGDAVSKLRKKGNLVEHFIEEASEWFKYGDGQYDWNKFKAVMKVIGAGISMAAIAAAAVAASPGLAAVAVAGSIAGSIYLALQMGNAQAVSSQNEKAKQFAKQGKSGMARYYGDTGGVRDYITKTDFGDEKSNAFMGGLGFTYDILEKGSKLVRDASQIILTWLTPSHKVQFENRKIDRKHIDELSWKERYEIVRKEKKMDAMKKVYKYERKNPRKFTSPHSFSLPYFLFGNPLEKIDKEIENCFSEKKGFLLNFVNNVGKNTEKLFRLNKKSDYRKIEEYLTDGPKVTCDGMIDVGSIYDISKSAISVMEDVDGISGVIDYTPVNSVFTLVDDTVDIVDVFLYGKKYQDGNIYKNAVKKGYTTEAAVQ